MGSLIYIFSSRVDLCFAVHKLGKFLSNPCKVHLEGLIHLLKYIRDNKNLGLKYYANIYDENISELLRKARIKTEKQLMVFYVYIWQDLPYTGRSTR